MGDTALSITQEERLVEKALGGNGEAFAKIYDAYKSVLYTTVIYPRLRNVQAAEEVLQETFLLALRKLPDFRFEGKSILFWLRVIAMNKVHERLNSDRRSSTVDDTVLSFHPDATWQPEQKTVAKQASIELRQRILVVLELLNERYRSAIEMRLLQRMTREECAEKLSVTIETFDVLFFRACKSFREKFIKEYGEIPGLPSD